MVIINLAELNFAPDNDKEPAKDKKITQASEKSAALQTHDSVILNKAVKNDTDNVFKNSAQIKPGNGQSLNKEEAKEQNPGPWKIKSLQVAYGLQNVKFSNTDIRIQQPGDNTDLTMHNVEGEQRTSYSYIYGKPRFAPDEPEFNAKASVEFENHFGLELDAKHNKYTVQKYDQNVLMTGTMNGGQVDGVRPFNSYSDLYDITRGNHQISLMGTYSFPLPAPEGHSFTFNTKAGPSALVSYSHNRLKNPAGEMVETDGSFGFVGYGGVVENSLKYDFGRKLGGVTLELSHSLSYLNFTSVPVAGGSSSQSMWANQFALTVGKTFDFSKKK